jgi:hypothetical protein
VLDRCQNGDLKMLHCRIVEPGKPDEIADCYAWAIREMAQPIEDEGSQVESYKKVKME